jgi:cytochrome oxidase assembly protein ShyY1
VYRFLATPRWIGLHLLVLACVPSFILLGHWQLDRFHERRAQAAQVERAQAMPPQPLERLDQPGGVVAHGRQNRQVAVAGRYDTAHQVLARLRSQDGQTGFFVITPLIRADGVGVLVNRGFVQTDASGSGPAAVPAPPTGQITLTGRLQRSEGAATNTADLPAGQIQKIDSGQLAPRLGYPLYAGYVDLATQTPPAAATPASVPPEDTSGDDDSVGMLSWQNMSYVVTWWLFAVLAVGFWVRMLRRERAAVLAARRDDSAEPAFTDREISPVSAPARIAHSERRR